MSKYVKFYINYEKENIFVFVEAQLWPSGSCVTAMMSFSLHFYSVFWFPFFNYKNPVEIYIFPF